MATTSTDQVPRMDRPQCFHVTWRRLLLAPGEGAVSVHQEACESEDALYTLLNRLLDDAQNVGIEIRKDDIEMPVHLVIKAARTWHLAQEEKADLYHTGRMSLRDEDFERFCYAHGEGCIRECEPARMCIKRAQEAMAEKLRAVEQVARYAQSVIAENQTPQRPAEH